MLLFPGDRKDSSTFIIPTPAEVAKRLGCTVESMRMGDPSWVPDMDGYIGLEVRIIRKPDHNGNVILEAVNGRRAGLSSFLWSLEWLKPFQVKSQKKDSDDGKDEVSPKNIEISEDKDYTVTIGDGEIVITVSGEDLSKDDDGFLRVDLSTNYANGLGASDWFVLDSLCTTDFGTQDGGIIWVPESCVREAP